MKQRMTLIEWLVVLSFSAIVFCAVYALASGGGSDTYNAWIFPDQARAQAQQRMVNEMSRQNELLRKQLELKERELNNK